MTRIGFALLALLPWLPWSPAPLRAEPRLSAPSELATAAPAPEGLPAPAPPAAREGERLSAEPVPAPQPGPRAQPAAAADRAAALAPSGLRLVGALAAVGALLALGRLAARRFLVRSSHARRTVPSGRFLRSGFPGLGRWFASAGAVEEDLAVVGRSRLGARESVCVVRSGQERFLVGVSQAGISLLARLGSLAAAPAGAAEPAEAAEPVGVALPEEGELSRASRRGERTWGSPERSEEGELSRASRRGERTWESPERSEEPAADDFAAELAHAAVGPGEETERLEGELSRVPRRGERTWGSPERSELAELLARSRERLLRLTLSSSSPHAKQRRG